jgi:hypothetical protein
MNITNPSQLSYQAAASLPPVKRTLNDYRINPVNYEAQGASQQSGLQPGWVVALLIVLIGAGAFAVSQRGGFTKSPPNPVVATDPSVPSATSVSNTTAAVSAPATPEAAARDSAASAPLAPMNKASESNEMPKALQGNNHSSPSVTETVKPVAPAKPAARSNTKAAPASRMVEPLPAPVTNQVVPPVEAPPPAPLPPITEPTVPAPQPPVPEPTPAPKPQ